jgi:putative ABC transport system permease protein
MDIHAIFASLRRSLLGPVLIALQVALTLAILLNVAGIVREHVGRMHSVSGLDEANVFSLVNRPVGQSNDTRGGVDQDLAVIRGTPGVVAAVSSNGVPLSGRGWDTQIDTRPIDPARSGSLTRGQLYYFDEQGADALGLTLQQGRWFSADEAANSSQAKLPSVAILTRALANHLFPAGDALGKVIYMGGGPVTVVGIVAALQDSGPGNPAYPLEMAGYSAIMPAHFAYPGLNNYIVRTRPGAQAAAMKEVERRLREANPQRVIIEFKTFAETRHDAYRANRALTAILVAVNLLLIGITALGIAGLASYWVAQRQRMIGVRRALGATRGDILAYFHGENLLIVGIGVLLGTGIAFGLNNLLVKAGVPRIESAWLWGGLTAVLVIGQLAVLVPASRAARVPPSLAIRSG